MAYDKTVWEAREGENLDLYTKQNETSATVILINTPDLVTREGTPFSTGNMNHIEDGIEAAHNLIAEETQQRTAAITGEQQARQAAIAGEAQSRQAAIAGEGQARQQGDQALHRRIDDLQYFVDYLVSLINSEWGSIARTISLVTEAGDYLVTEDGDYLVTA